MLWRIENSNSIFHGDDWIFTYKPILPTLETSGFLLRLSRECLHPHRWAKLPSSQYYLPKWRRNHFFPQGSAQSTMCQDICIVWKETQLCTTMEYKEPRAKMNLGEEVDSAVWTRNKAHINCNQNIPGKKHSREFLFLIFTILSHLLFVNVHCGGKKSICEQKT